MATYTSDLGLKKPAVDDFADIGDINGNMDIIDLEIGKLKSRSSTLYSNKWTYDEETGAWMQSVSFEDYWPSHVKRITLSSCLDVSANSIDCDPLLTIGAFLLRTAEDAVTVGAAKKPDEDLAVLFSGVPGKGDAEAFVVQPVNGLHSKIHAMGGVDPVTPEQIGAAPVRSTVTFYKSGTTWAADNSFSYIFEKYAQGACIYGMQEEDFSCIFSIAQASPEKMCFVYNPAPGSSQEFHWYSDGTVKFKSFPVVQFTLNTDKTTYRSNMTRTEVATLCSKGANVVAKLSGSTFIWTLKTTVGSGNKLTFYRYATENGRPIIDSFQYSNETTVNRFTEELFPVNQNTCSIFKRVVCIGDSATAGHIDYGYASDGTLQEGVKMRRNEAYAWPAFMAKLTGNEYINLGVSGATAITWLEGSHAWVPRDSGYPSMAVVQFDGKWWQSALNNNTYTPGVEEAVWVEIVRDVENEGAFFDATEKTITVYASWKDNGVEGSFSRTIEDTDTISAYLIGLGMNDTANASTDNGNIVDNGTEDAKLPLGNSSEIGTDARTFYGKYSQIIENIHAVSPKAHIFVQTMHANLTDRRLEYNEAIREIASYYSTLDANPIPVHVLDLYEYRYMYEIDSILYDKIGNHWSPISYQQFAEILKRIWSNYLNTHPAEFKDVHLIN